MKKKRIDILYPYPKGEAAAQRFRIEQFIPELSEKFTIKTYSFWSNSTWSILYKNGHFFRKLFGFIGGIAKRKLYLVKALQVDYIYILREATPIGPPFIEWFLAKVMRKKIIYDFDDAIWLPNQSEVNKGLVKNLKYHKKVGKICTWAHCVCVGNEFLAEYARQFNDNVILIPTTVDTEKYHNPDWFSKKEDDRIVIGWTGTHSTLHQLDIVWPVLNELADTYSFEFHLIADYFPENLPKYVRKIAWNKEREIQDLMKFDIGIMPLKESDWERGKCGFKLIQYMALKIPAVASAFGANLEIVENSDQAILIKKNDSEEWKKAFISLIDDPALRVKIGQSGRKRIVEAYSKQALENRILELFKE